ncbi:hypothetical protein TWF594_010138 [Orbilia oligospora]|nr:hypothetical protein TWF706_000939 [Orbilia oligospora]KAF3131064.1 hypothetical protein TWF594_010138 [Orbilia oligospora]
MGLTKPFVFVPLIGLLISSVSALEVGVEILDEETKLPLGLPYLKLCRPPDSNPSWPVIVIDPLVTFCETVGPGISMGVGMEPDWKARTSLRRPEGDIPFTYLYLVGPQSGIPLTNDPDRSSSSWFGYGTNSYKNYEASIFEVARTDANGERVPQTINFENPLQVGDILEWAGPNGFEGDYQLRLGSNTEGGIQRIMRSDKPVYDFLPIRLVVLELHEAEVLEELPPERVVRNPKPEVISAVLEDIAGEEDVIPEPGPQGIVQSYLPDQRPERPSKDPGLGRSLLNMMGFGGKKPREERVEESKEEVRYNDPSKSKGWDPKYTNPFDKPPAGSRINKDVVKDEPTKSTSRWGNLWGNDKSNGKGTEEVIQPRPVTHSRQPIKDLDTETFVEKATGTVMSLIQRIPKIPNILPKKVDKDYPLAKPVEVPVPVIDNIPVNVPKEGEDLLEENDEDIDVLRQSSAYGRNLFGDNGGPGNDVL